MTDVLKLLQFDVTRSHRLRWMGTSECLNRGHFIGANQVNALFMQTRCRLIKVTDDFDLRLKGNWVFRIGIEPVAIPVWL